MTGESLVNRYQTIWNDFVSTKINVGTEKSNDKLLDRGFVFQFDKEEKNVDVLYIGINPSYQGIKERSDFYTKENALKHSYFKPFKFIEEELMNKYNKKVTWTHIDLLVFRETLQKFVLSLIKSQEGLEFVWRQLEVAREILNYFNPKVLVVSNTQARTFLGADQYSTKSGERKNIWMDYDFKFDREIGTHKIVGETLNPYVFLTSMLSGQRALDKGSRERLVWHINEVLAKKF